MKIPEDAEEVRVQPYRAGSHECCCGDLACTYLEDRMNALGASLDQLTTVTFEKRLERT